MNRGLVCLLLLCACDDGWHEDSPVDRAVTSWRLISSADDRDIAVTLEPRKVTRHEQGVLTLGYSTAVVGPTILVDKDGAQLATFDLGATDVIAGATRAWVLQMADTSWPHVAPPSGSPHTPYVRATIVDRLTFATRPSVALDPPIVTPVVVGDELYDVPAAGASDIERDIFVRRRTDAGDVTVLHAGRGFGIEWCARGDGLLVAYQHGADVVFATVHGDQVATATFADTRFDPIGIACDGGADRAALVVTTGLAVFDVATSTIALWVPGASGPAVLREDGAAMASVRPDDRHVLFTDATGSKDTGLVSAKNPANPKVALDRGMFELETALGIVDLYDGSIAQIPSLSGTSMIPFEITAAPSALVAALSAFDDVGYGEHLARLVVIDDGGTTELPLPYTLEDAELRRPSGDRLYVKAYADDIPHLHGFDLATKTHVLDVPLPLCDEAAVLAARGCR